jgi:hypothetical protein
MLCALARLLAAFVSRMISISDLAFIVSDRAGFDVNVFFAAWCVMQVEYPLPAAG